tara:strand:+ start:201 stop:356 length:156 start_codon:yes stop_codon:yes gene_type:complete
MTKTLPIRSFTHPRFHYVPAANTDIRVTFKKYARLLKIAAIRAAQQQGATT